MKKEIHKLYKNEEIDFILNKNLKFFLIKKESNSRYARESINIQVVSDRNELIFDNGLVNTSVYSKIKEIKELSDKNEIIQNIGYGYSNRELSEEFFYVFYKKYPKYRKELLGNGYSYFNINIKKDLNRFLEKTSENYNEAEKNLLDYPISVLTVQGFDFENLEKKLKSMGGNEDNLYSFWLKFFKARKNQISNPSIAPEVADFLISRFEYEKLEKFFPFFSFLQAKYQEVEPDIFDGDHEYATSVFINLKKMSKVFGLDGWSYDKFEIGLKNYMLALKKYYGLEEALFADISRAKKLFSISFFHNNEKFTKELLKGRIVQLFNSLKSSNKQATDLTESFLNSWIAKQELQEKLSEKSENKNKRLKV